MYGIFTYMDGMGNTMIHQVSTREISIHGLCLHVLEALVTFFLGFFMGFKLTALYALHVR